MGAPLVGYGLGGGLVHLLGAGGTLLLSAPAILGLLACALALPTLAGAAGAGRVKRSTPPTLSRPARAGAERYFRTDASSISTA